MQPPDFWYPKKRGDVPILARILSPLGALYAMGAALRSRFTTPRRAGLPVICVGNLTLGGTGKTPIVIALAQELIQQGKRPIILTRGYGGRLEGPVKVDPEVHTARDVGDEPLLLARVAPVVVSADRPMGAAFAANEDADVILMDDGFQNPTIYKDFSIVVIDGQRQIGNGHVFPAGPLRESPTAGLARADLVIMMGASAGTPLPPHLATFTGPVVHANLKSTLAAEALKGRKVLAFAGIGLPEKFFRTVRESGARVVAEVPFPDHHRFRRKDIEALKKRATELEASLVTTEKDAVRLPRAETGILTIPVEAQFDDHDLIEDTLERWMKHEPQEKVTIRVSEDKRQAKPQHYVEAFFFYGIMGFFRVLGRDRASNFAGRSARWLGPKLSVANRARRNLALVMPELSDEEKSQIIADMFENLGRTFAEYSHLDRFHVGDGKGNADIAIENAHIIEELVAKDQGAILISGHLANWELLGKVVDKCGGRGAAVYRAPNNPFVDDWIARQRAAHIFPVMVPKGPEGGRALIKAIREGNYVSMLVDQKMNDGIAVPFFGREAMTAPAAASLAIRYKIPIVPFDIQRLEGLKFKVTIHPPADIELSGDVTKDTFALTAWQNDFLERVIRKNPAQWLWLHQRWGKFKDEDLPVAEHAKAAE